MVRERYAVPPIVTSCKHWPLWPQGKLRLRPDGAVGALTRRGTHQLSEGLVTLVGDSHGRMPGTQDRSLFGAPVSQERAAPDGPDFNAIASRPEFDMLRRRQRRFVFPVTVLFMAWYLTFVLLAAYAHGFMSRPVLGLINVGMVLGLAQFASTLVIMLAYTKYAGRRLDPACDDVRRAAERRA